MHYIQNLRTALQHSWQGVKSHKLLFITLILLQFLVLALLVYITLTHQLKVISSLQNILNPLQQANYDPQLVDAGQPFLQEVKTIYDSYKALVWTLISFVSWSLALFLLPQSLIWLGSHLLLEEKQNLEETLKQKFSSWIKYIAAAVACSIPIIIVTYILAKITIAQGETAPLLLYSKTILLVGSISYYLLATAFAVLSTLSWKDWIKSIIETAFKKIEYVFPLFLGNMFLLLVLIYGIYRTLNSTKLFTLTIILSGVFLILLVFLRLLWISYIQQLQKHE